MAERRPLRNMLPGAIFRPETDCAVLDPDKDRYAIPDQSQIGNDNIAGVVA